MCCRRSVMKIQRLLTCCRSRRCLFGIVLIMSIIFTFILNGFFQMKRRSCSKSEEKRILADLCHLYHNGRFTGSLCPHLCDSRSIRLETCLSGGASKTVILGTWDGVPIVIKSRRRDTDDLQPMTVWEIEEDGQGRVSKAPEVGMFEMMIHNEVSSVLSTDIPEDKKLLVQKLSDGSYDPEKTKPTLAFMNTLMTLVRQEEYINFKYFLDSIYYPEVHGNCGNFYGVEYIPVDRMLSSISLSSYGSRLGWKDRVRIALSLIETIMSLDGNFEDRMERLHMCDMKAENFGVGENLAVKVIDGDMMFSSAKMESILESEECSTDEDCDFFDCEGICDVMKRKCMKTRKNLNFQVLCRDILSTGIMGTQLLKSPPEEFKDMIRAEVEKGSQLYRTDRVKQGWDPSLKLRELLRRQIRSQGSRTL